MDSNWPGYEPSYRGPEERARRSDSGSADSDAAASALSHRAEDRCGEAGSYCGCGVSHVYQERSPADLGVVHPFGDDAHVVGENRGIHGGGDAVYLAGVNAGVGNGVHRGVYVELGFGHIGDDAKLAGLGRSDYGGLVSQ